ncbi:preprotein translocase subunit YajC [Muribaculum sp. An289]|jgi:preprotein translocase subunit YajC|uniref:preprotein translocase subunit YajC n=1 Tax=unclassified Muribaculum TaxID=2622126 RepID=UPI000B392D82|nr:MULTISPECIES: preprotein translocase subunit YajC [unclassified Muribaculum]OUO37981.1 preprotein translocase subunit YajC [Muribaculum sp. An289]OUO44316.1 preprotein translocase subunit YajC [Muribaculum sp. An287]
MNFLTLLDASAGQAANSAGGGSGWMSIAMIVLIFVVMYFFMIRPQQKKQKELNQFRASLKKGDKIVTVGGIYGVVCEVKDDKLVVEIDNNVKILVDKSAVVKDMADTQR